MNKNKCEGDKRNNEAAKKDFEVDEFKQLGSPNSNNKT